MWQVTIFVMGFLGILALSWRSLRPPRNHGFYRFFAFTGMLVMIVLNLPVWFRDPFSPLQLLSWLTLMSSLALAAHGFYLLRVIGRPQGQFENTTEIVRTGAYRFIRHPLYASLLLLALGAFLKSPSSTGVILLALVVVSLVATARVEEQENLIRFGDRYAEYMTTTRMFVPGVW